MYVEDRGCYENPVVLYVCVGSSWGGVSISVPQDLFENQGGFLDFLYERPA